jgi:predicted nucleic acid-binding protein
MALIVLDASILIAHLDPSDHLHTAAVPALKARAADDLVLPASAYAEVLVDPARKRRLGSVRSQIQALLISVEPIGEAIAERAAYLRARHRALRLPDALVIAVGEELGAEAILTGDRRWRRISTLVQVIS